MCFRKKKICYYAVDTYNRIGKKRVTFDSLIQASDYFKKCKYSMMYSLVVITSVVNGNETVLEEYTEEEIKI